MSNDYSLADEGFWFLAAFILGIFVAPFGWIICPIVAMVGIIFCALFSAQKKIWWRIAAGVLASFCAGVLLYRFYVALDAESLRLPIGKEISFLALVVSDPSESAKYEIFTADPWHSHALTVLAPPTSGFRYGDLLEINGFLGSPDGQGKNPFVIPLKITIIGHHHGSRLLEALSNFKRSILKRFVSFLPQDQAALLGGVTIGGSSGMSVELKNEMEASGTSYVLSMYGFKIAAIIALASSIFAYVLPRRVSLLIGLCIIALFVLMAGLIASAVRAGIMAAIALISQGIGRPFNKRNALMFTASIMLCFNPFLLAGDIGFQLSFLSVIGILCLTNPIKRYWRYKSPGFLLWRDGVTTTIAVLAPMVPFITAPDGKFTVSAILSNTLMFLATLYTFFLGISLAAASFISSPASFMIAEAGSIILKYQLLVVKFFSIVAISFPISFHEPVVVIIYYAAIVIFIISQHEDF